MLGVIFCSVRGRAQQQIIMPPLILSAAMETATVSSLFEGVFLLQQLQLQPQLQLQQCCRTQLREEHQGLH